MITRFINIDGDEHGVHADGSICKRETIFGLSTDVKPTSGIRNADIFYEMDTQKVSLFDEANSAWLEQ